MQIQKHVSSNALAHHCQSCGYEFSFDLIKLKKKVIYLDQFFISSIAKGQSKYVHTFKILSDLVHKQLVVCPRSHIHDKESHLITDEQKREVVWNLFKKISQGKRFNFSTKIVDYQVIHAYFSFIRDESSNYKLEEFDALDPSIHDWTNSLYIDIDSSITNFISADTFWNEKHQFSTDLIKIIPERRKYNNTIDENFNIELAHYRDSFIKSLGNYSNSRVRCIDYYRIANTIKSLDSDSSYDVNQKLYSFFHSKHFENIPYINISCGLWAMIKDEIQGKRFLANNDLNKKVAEIRSIPDDIDFISLYSPYCDSIFIDKRMAQLINRWKNHTLSSSCNFKVFSSQNLDEFDNYLNEIFNHVSHELKDELEMVYGQF